MLAIIPRGPPSSSELGQWIIRFYKYFDKEKHFMFMSKAFVTDHLATFRSFALIPLNTTNIKRTKIQPII